MSAAAFLACDWGTTNLRAWLATAEGRALRYREFPFGVSALAPGEAARRFAEEVRPALGAADLPAVLCGMIGSDLGWRPAGYLPCPASLSDLAAALVTVEPAPASVRIAPGLSGPGVTAARDVMRGEETQVFGWLLDGPDRMAGEHLICHPGTHAKWIRVRAGRIDRFATAMTGELFAVLRKHSLLRQDAPADDEGQFDAGVEAAGDGGALAARLFSARSRVAAGEASSDSTPSYLSGLLIGAEVAALPSMLGGSGAAPVVLLGDEGLCRWYGRAMDRCRLAWEWHDGQRAALLGLAALYRVGDAG